MLHTLDWVSEAENIVPMNKNLSSHKASEHTMIEGQNLIGGEWLAGEGETLDTNPSDSADPIGRFALATSEQARRAVAAAREAFPKWAAASPLLRHDVLQRAAYEIAARGEELATLIAREEGKTLADARREVARTSQIFQFHAGECLRSGGEKIASVRDGVEIDITREPLGVVTVITPWNFPLAIPAWKIAPALAWGNCVVFKPAELVPASAHALAGILQRAGVPPGVFNLVVGRSSQIGAELIESDEVDAISFTGSVNTGRLVASAASQARRLKRVQLEMGGKNPLVVLDDASLEIAVSCALDGAFLQTGQRCTASSRVIVTRGIHGRFVAAMLEGMKGLIVGHACHEQTNIGPVAEARQFQQDLSYVEIGRAEGATLARGGAKLKRETEGYFLEPALFVDVHPSMRIAREEIFGPVASVIQVADYEEAFAVANDTEFGLSAGICTASLKHANHFRRNAQAGMVMVNLPTAGVDHHVPFGGTKGSSHGPREQGTHARDMFTKIKTAYVFGG